MSIYLDNAPNSTDVCFAWADLRLMHETMVDSASKSSVMLRGSRAVSLAAVELFDTKVIEPSMGKPMPKEAKAELSGLLAALIDNASPTRSGSFAWGLAGFLALALVVTGGALTWDKIGEVESRQDAGDHYAQTLAHYLMVKANNDHTNAVSADQLLRALASAAQLDTAHIPTPIQSPPPASVQRRSAEHREGQGE